MFHGTADKHVPYVFIQQLEQLFKANGVSDLVKWNDCCVNAWEGWRV